MSTLVLFLDIDGVLCVPSLYMSNGWIPYSKRLEPSLLKQLKRVTDATKCDIILSSTWRLYPAMVTAIKEAFWESGIPDIVGCTTKLHMPSRRDQIREYLGVHHEITGFAIVDDGGDAEIEGHFVQTEFKEGLTKEKADELIKILKRQS